MTDCLPLPSRHAVLGTAQTRIDGPAKVGGRTPFAGDMRLPGMAHARLVRSPIARGRITAIGRDATLALPGVLDVLTFAEVGAAVRPVGHVMAGGWANSTARPLASPEVRHAGQIVAVVVGDTPEAAQAGADSLRVGYAAAPHAARLGDAGTQAMPLGALHEDHEDRAAGDLAAGLAAAARVVDQRYATPIQHHNPIELPGTICLWSGDDLTVWEPTRFVGAVRHGPMPSVPNSLTMTAMRRPRAWDRTWRSSVVLPAPRKPVTTVAGMRAMALRRPGWRRRRGRGRPGRRRGGRGPSRRRAGRGRGGSA